MHTVMGCVLKVIVSFQMGLIITVEFLAASGTLASESNFPQQIKFLGRRYWYNIFISCIYLFTEYPKII